MSGFKDCKLEDYIAYGVRRNEYLPIIESYELDFFRCIEFKDDFYEKTISELHKGNLRCNTIDNRYSNLFPGQKLSYWADTPKTARAEIKKHGAGNNILTFWAYDDGSSFIPTIYPSEKITIIDGISAGFDKILKKVGNHEPLTDCEKDFIDAIGHEKPDCLAYRSEAYEDGICYLFFESGFKKLSIKKASLRLGSRKSKNTNAIICADTCDYTPYIENYGYCFSSIAKVRFDEEYLKSDEYKLRNQVEKHSLERIRRIMK